MRWKLSIILMFFSYGAFSQLPDKGNTKELINKISPWDNGFKGCYGIAPVHDTIMNILIKKGKPIGKQLLALLDSTDKAVPAHFMLSVIYGDSIQSNETVSRTEGLVIKRQELNGLIWTTELIMPATIKHSLDPVSLRKIKEMWVRRLK